MWIKFCIPNARSVIRRYAPTLLLCLAITCTALVMQHSGIRKEHEFLPKLLYFFSLSTLASLAVQLAIIGNHWSPKTYLKVAPVLFLLLGVFIWGLDTTYISIIFLSLGVALSLLVAPFIFRKDESPNCVYHSQLLAAIFWGSLATGVFCGGLSILFTSITFLLDIPIPRAFYSYTWIIGITLFFPTYALGQLPDQFNASSQSEKSTLRLFV